MRSRVSLYSFLENIAFSRLKKRHFSKKIPSGVDDLLTGDYSALEWSMAKNAAAQNSEKIVGIDFLFWRGVGVQACSEEG